MIELNEIELLDVALNKGGRAKNRKSITAKAVPGIHPGPSQRNNILLTEEDAGQIG